LLLLLIKFQSKSIRERIKKKLRRIILELSVRFSTINLREISEKYDAEKYLMVKIINELLGTSEIEGSFDKKLKMLKFERKIESSEIDLLIAKFDKLDFKQKK
ncbi:MAG: hypothetical protein ACXAAH_16435, partial [Promethearchaeota archaeon]